MKIKFALLSTIFFCVLSVNQGFAQNRPNCVSPASDADGDGYGWENNETCLVVAQPRSCEDRGSFPWGWNPVTLTSCRLDEQPGQCVDTDPIGDGWGWNGTSSCTIEVPTTNDDFETYLGQMMGTLWSCYELDPFNEIPEQFNVLDRRRLFTASFHADGVSAVTLFGAGDNSFPSGPETNPGAWSRGYPVEDWELHINGRYNTSRGNFLDRLVNGEWGQSKETLIHWQMILQITERKDSDRFDGTFYFRDSVAEYQWDVSCVGRTYDSSQGLNDNLFER